MIYRLFIFSCFKLRRGLDKDTTSAITGSGAFSNTWVRSN
jgi:hypothetical protein